MPLKPTAGADYFLICGCILTFVIGLFRSNRYV
jgi:hypothetical protein